VIFRPEFLRSLEIRVGARPCAQGDSNIQRRTVPVRRVLNELPGHISMPALRLLAWLKMQPDCISSQAHRSLIPHFGGKVRMRE
jgi:hypothetical protein